MAYENFKVVERQRAGQKMRKPMARILPLPTFGGRNAQPTSTALEEWKEIIGKTGLAAVFEDARVINP